MSQVGLRPPSVTPRARNCKGPTPAAVHLAFAESYSDDRDQLCGGKDSSVSPAHGKQELSVWSGHYECTCYHPLFVFNQFGDLERRALRPGNVHAADEWEGMLKPVW